MSTNVGKNSLKDILYEFDENRVNENVFAGFRQYRSKKDIGSEISNSLRKKVLKKGSNANLFYLADTNKAAGLISVAQGLISLTLVLQLQDNTQIDDDEKKLLATNLNELLKYIKCEDNQYHFYATPFVKTKNVEEDNEDTPKDDYMQFEYVDGIAKCLQAFMECRELLYLGIESGDLLNLNKYVPELKSDEELKIEIEKLIIEAIKKIVDLKITIPQEAIEEVKIGNLDPIKIDCAGWNFTNNNYDSKSLSPSLFFTYAVCLSYMTLYKNLGEAVVAKRLEVETGVLDERYKKLKEEDKKFARDFKWIDENYDTYNAFRHAVRSCGLYLDNKIKNLDLRSKFLGIDYENVDINEIKNSTTNNALFNSAFAVTILIASGVSDLYDEQKDVVNRRYFEWLQSIMQNIYDSYCDLVIIRKDYAVSQYLLSFNENIPNELSDAANYLRRQRIQTATLVPAMIRSYNLVSTYVIQYPQKQMCDYLELIMENRHLVKGKAEWLWDKDNYDICINTLYIAAMYDFYEYYENYESQYIETEKKIESEKNKAEELRLKQKSEYEKILESKEQEIIKLEKEKEELNNEMDKTPIVLAIKDIVRSTLKEELMVYMSEVFHDTSKYLTKFDMKFIKQPKDDKDVVSIFSQRLLELFMAYFASTINDKFDKQSVGGVEEFKKMVKDDIILENDLYVDFRNNLADKAWFDKFKKFVDSISNFDD